MWCGRVQSFGRIGLSSSFLASCPLALSSTMFVHQRAVPLAQAEMGSELTRINHLGSFACRNIYNREGARRSEHATADALDISGFGFSNKQQISVLKGWNGTAKEQAYLHTLFANGCRFLVMLWGLNITPHMLIIFTWVCGDMGFVDKTNLYDKLHALR